MKLLKLLASKVKKCMNFITKALEVIIEKTIEVMEKAMSAVKSESELEINVKEGTFKTRSSTLIAAIGLTTIIVSGVLAYKGRMKLSVGALSTGALAISGLDLINSRLEAGDRRYMSDAGLVDKHTTMDKEIAHEHSKLDKEVAHEQSKLDKEIAHEQSKLDKEIAREQSKLDKEIAREQYKLDVEDKRNARDHEFRMAQLNA